MPKMVWCLISLLSALCSLCFCCGWKLLLLYIFRTPTHYPSGIPQMQFTWHFSSFLSTLRHRCISCFEIHEVKWPVKGQYITYIQGSLSFQTFFVWALLLIVHTWNSSPLPSNLLRMQCTCTVPTTSGRPHGSSLVWACQWPSSQSLSSQLSHNDSLWA